MPKEKSKQRHPQQARRESKRLDMCPQKLKTSKSELPRALKLHQAGQFRKAAELYEQVLRADPRNAEALHLSGLVAHQQGRIDEAVGRIKQAVSIRPGSATFQKNLCAVLTAAGRFDEATAYFNRLVDLDAEDWDAWFSLGNLYQQLGRFDDAIHAYRQVLQIKPEHVGGLHNLGAAYHAQGELKQAASCFQAALRLNPGLAQLHYGLGNVYMKLGALDDAIQLLRQAVHINPDYVEARFNLANLYKDMGDFEAAVENYSALLKTAPAMAEAHNNLGNVFSSLNRDEDALKCYQAAIDLHPEYAEAMHNMSIVLQNAGHYEAAMRHCHKAIELKPDYDAAYASLAHQMRQACAWEKLEKIDRELDQLTCKALAEDRRPAENPFLNLSRHADPALNLAVARAWSRDLSQKIEGVTPYGTPDESANLARRSGAQRLRIGYLSNNFRNHPTAHLLIRLFGLHDRDQFKVYAYSYGQDDGSEYRRRIEQDCDSFVDLCSMDDRAAAARIRDDRIDILVDLVGYMKGHRLGICARRPAPVLVRYLGMAGTTGADFFDYIIVDAMVVPEEHSRYYSEKLVYMPHCYQINDDLQAIAGAECTKAQFALPRDVCIYCSFASHYKLDPIMFAAWMRILDHVEASVLWLTPGSQLAAQNLTRQAEAHGIDPKRLVFADRVSKEHHLARLKLADLALDTRLVGGAATTSDALWSGVPVITLLGNHFASRMSSSLLRAIGLEELITRDLTEFETLAIRLGRNPRELETLKQKIFRQRKAGDLFNTEAMVRHLEAAFDRMWADFNKGEKPMQIRL